ncbi:MAG: Type secretion system protein [Pseudomonadota bacterium]|jgi:general secretion pathway protein G
MKRIRNFVEMMRRPFAGNQNSMSGMSLIEIIIVVALMGTLMAYLVRNLIGQQEEAKKDQTKLGMGVIEQSLQLYRVHNGRYPTTEQGLDAMMTAPSDVKTWRGPYIEANKLSDPWNVKFQYESDGRNFKIISGGPDGQIGNADDIVYPEQAAGAAGNP